MKYLEVILLQLMVAWFYLEYLDVNLGFWFIMQFVYPGVN